MFIKDTKGANIVEVVLFILIAAVITIGVMSRINLNSAATAINTANTELSNDLLDAVDALP